MYVYRVVNKKTGKAKRCTYSRSFWSSKEAAQKHVHNQDTQEVAEYELVETRRIPNVCL